MSRMSNLPCCSGIYKLKSVLFIILIAVVIQSCEPYRSPEIYNPTFVLEKNEIFPLGWTVERGYETSFMKIEDPLTGKYKLKMVASPVIPTILSQKIFLKDSGSYFIIGKFRLELDSGVFFIAATTSFGLKEMTFTASIETCKRTLFSMHIPEPSELTLRIGFKNNSGGIAYPDTLFAYKEDYFEGVAFDITRIDKEIEALTGVSGFNQDNFDYNIDLLAKSLNIAFLAEESEERAPLIDFFSSDQFETERTFYLRSYLLDEFSQLNTSLPLDELLKLYRIPVRQLYWQKNCVSYHRFIEYWNSFDKKWKIIDPYFGARYINTAGKYIGFEEAEFLASEGNFSVSNIRKLNIETPFYDEKKIMDGWQSEITVHIIKK